MHPCARCALAQKTCCQRAEILLTGGDVSRIAAADSPAGARPEPLRPIGAPDFGQ